MKILLVSPHPDDEIVGAPGAVTALATAGHHVTNLACGFGRTAQHATRERELRLSVARAGFTYAAITPPVGLSGSDGDDMADARKRIAHAVYARATAYDLILSPGIPDGHPAHELVALAVSDALGALSEPPTWWAWATSPRNYESELHSLWCRPTVFVPYHADTMARALYALSAHESEMTRHDYRKVIVDRARLSALWLGLVSHAYADLFVEVIAYEDRSRSYGGRCRCAGLVPAERVVYESDPAGFGPIAHGQDATRVLRAVA